MAAFQSRLPVNCPGRPLGAGVYFFESMTGAFLRAGARKNRAIRSNSSQKQCQAPFLLRDFRFYPLRGRRIQPKTGALTGITRRRKINAGAPPERRFTLFSGPAMIYT
jgi:hypothetical protein